jgi:hypothetical protein
VALAFASVICFASLHGGLSLVLFEVAEYLQFKIEHVAACLDDQKRPFGDRQW